MLEGLKEQTLRRRRRYNLGLPMRKEEFICPSLYREADTGGLCTSSTGAEPPGDRERDHQRRGGAAGRIIGTGDSWLACSSTITGRRLEMRVVDRVFGYHDREDYERQSPLNLAPSVKTPTLIIHSEQDLRCPMNQGQELYVALKLCKVPTRLVLYPEESHDLSRGGRPDRRIDRLERIRAWMDEYLMK